MSRRLVAILALVALLAGMVFLVGTAARAFPRGLVVLALLTAAVVAGWQGLVRGGRVRTLWWAAGAVLVVVAVAWQLADGVQRPGVVGVLLLAAGIAASRRAFAVHADLPRAPPPQRAVVIYNPKSGGGKAVTHHLADEARRRSIEPIELKPGDDLVDLVREAVARGADGLAAAGGDGTQALVATFAAQHDLPFACIPAGTRNHFALDLGVDREDVVGALDAFVDGGERTVDLAEVGGRVFVNNVSLGLYAKAVQEEGYRDAKIRTLIDTAPTVLAPGADGGTSLRWAGPDGAEHSAAAVILVSNNVYRLGRVMSPGTRPRLDAGRLGVGVLGSAGPDGRRQGLVQWSTPEFTVTSDADIPVGVDGEALMMPSPLTFRIRPAALRVRIAPQHPGASPSAGLPSSFRHGLAMLGRLAMGGQPQAR